MLYVYLKMTNSEVRYMRICTSYYVRTTYYMYTFNRLTAKTRKPDNCRDAASATPLSVTW